MRRAAALLALGLSGALPAQAPVSSPAPEAVSVSIYRGGNGSLDLDWLAGYALITETRTVDLPAGPSELRFEGVAGGIIPVSAIVTGLPGGTTERNRDARLLSPGGLVDANLGERVRIRRTSRATGQVTESEAVLRSGPDGVVLQTPAGIEALRCTGLPETLVYADLPAGLTDKPTLAVRTVSPASARATVRLSYLATGFDWRANYVVSIAPDGRRLDLFAWLTLANSNAESFPSAQAQAIAGSPNKEEEEELGESDVPTQLNLQCWPAGTTSDILLPPPPPPPAFAEGGYGGDDEYSSIVVTGSRIRESVMSVTAITTAVLEGLGDLKLYRIPEPVTVAANAQKQVALLTKTNVRYERLYGADVNARGKAEPEPVTILIRLQNQEKDGLGIPLPSGTAAVFEAVDGRPMLAGEAPIEDTAVGQEIDLRVGESPQVMIAQRELEGDGRTDEDGNSLTERREIEISNANPHPVTVETLIRRYGDTWRLTKPSRKLLMRFGRQMWRTKVPANGRSILSYTLERVPDPPAAEDED